MDGRLGTKIDALRDEMLTNFDAVYKRLDRLESEYHALRAAVERLEQRVARIEDYLKVELRDEIDELKTRIDELQQRVAQLEAQL